jgi:hypothetical protein
MAILAMVMQKERLDTKIPGPCIGRRGVLKKNIEQ